MTTLLEGLPEPDDATIAQRLRMHMGDKKISRAGLALQSGIGRTALSQKLDGNSPWTIDEVVSVAHAIGRSWIWVLTGKEETPPGPSGPGGALLLPRMDSNHQPPDHRSKFHRTDLMGTRDVRRIA